MKPHLTQTSRMVPSVVCFVAVLLAIAACGKKDDGASVGQSIDSGMAKTEQAAKAAMDKAAATMVGAGDTMKQAAKDAQASVSQASTTLGKKIDDLAITAAVSSDLAKDLDLSAIKISVDTKDGIVTLNGPAPTVAAKDKATNIARQVKGVSSVNNQLVVKAG